MPIVPNWKAKCRFCGSIHTISMSKTELKKWLDGPVRPCPGNSDTLSPKHMEQVGSWKEHYEILDTE